MLLLSKGATGKYPDFSSAWLVTCQRHHDAVMLEGSRCSVAMTTHWCRHRCPSHHLLRLQRCRLLSGMSGMRLRLTDRGVVYVVFVTIKHVALCLSPLHLIALVTVANGSVHSLSLYRYTPLCTKTPTVGRFY